MKGEDRTQLYFHIKSVGLEFADGIGSSWKIPAQYSAVHKNPLLKLLRSKNRTKNIIRYKYLGCLHLLNRMGSFSSLSLNR